MIVTEFPVNVIDVKLIQKRNAPTPILVTESGIVIDVKLELRNASSPILVTELGIVIDVKLEQLRNALPLILVTEFPVNVIDVKLPQFSNA